MSVCKSRKTSTFNIFYKHSSSPCCWSRGSRQRKQSMRGRGGGVWWLGVSCNQRGNSSFVLHAPPHWRLMNRITRFYSEQEADSWPRPCPCPALASAASLGADVTQMESGKMARTATWGCCKAAHLYPYSYSCTLVMCLVLHWHCLCPAPCQPTQPTKRATSLTLHTVCNTTHDTSRHPHISRKLIQNFRFHIFIVRRGQPITTTFDYVVKDQRRLSEILYTFQICPAESSQYTKYLGSVHLTHQYLCAGDNRKLYIKAK